MIRQTIRRNGFKLPKLEIDHQYVQKSPPSSRFTAVQTPKQLIKPIKIHDNLNVYLGSETDACNVQFLMANNINRVLSIQCKEINKRKQQKFQELGIDYQFIEASDCSATNLKQYFPEVCRYLDSNKDGNTLVHCQQGISRSATLCLAFMMRQLDTNFDDSFNMLRQRRHCVSPNFSFLGQLKAWENELRQHTITICKQESQLVALAPRCATPVRTH